MDVTSIATAGILAQNAQAQQKASFAMLRQSAQADQQIAKVLSETILETASTTATRGNNVNITV